ncbi:PQQ-dependent sugar dehydrogenase [Pseudalkalibacillus sp. Hm43]|uniref:PQQ-dependent sugar dehydrogenase n=1 Tax=Pseudalkalibacillus sp. Hm43 TaxID=3450742 RepID=UPI003F432085
MRILLSAILMIVLVGCSDQEQMPSEGKQNASEDTTQQVNGGEREDAEIIATKLKVPWQINVIDDTVYYLSGRTGEIMSVKDDSVQLQSVNLNKPVVARTEGGLLGIVVLGNQSEPQEAILYHTYEEDGRLQNRVVKVKKQKSEWQESDVLIEGIPGGRIHNGGRLAIGPDDKLYITTGDAGDEDQAQDLNTLGGKILRLNLDGSIPSDNPFEDSPIYSYGHRNPQGLGWTSEGKMYSSEHGQSAHDEINEIVPGGNYGWPIIQGDEEQEGLIRPVFHSGETTWAPSGMAISGDKVYVALLAGKQIRVFDLAKGTHEKWKDGFGRMRDVKIVDGTLYAVTNNTDGRGNPSENDDQLIKFSLDE